MVQPFELSFFFPFCWSANATLSPGNKRTEDTFQNHIIFARKCVPFLWLETLQLNVVLSSAEFQRGLQIMMSIDSVSWFLDLQLQLLESPHCSGLYSIMCASAWNTADGQHAPQSVKQRQPTQYRKLLQPEIYCTRILHSAHVDCADIKWHGQIVPGSSEIKPHNHVLESNSKFVLQCCNCNLTWQKSCAMVY